jgi:hypothetical protein
LGRQANYTYIDSGSINVIPGQNVPLQNLYRQSYNLIGMYERGDVSGRIAYNWRDKIVSGVVNITGAAPSPFTPKPIAGWTRR